MSGAPETRPRRNLRPVALVTLGAAAAGAAIGAAIAPDAPDAVPRAPAPRVGLTSGVATLPLPAGWEPLGRRSTLPGFEAATAVRNGDSEVALDIRAPERASLLPASVEAAADGLPAPQLRRLNTHAAWRYELQPTQAADRVVAFTLPTTGGVVTIACQAGAGSIARLEDECEHAVGSVQLQGATGLPPTPETAGQIVLPQVAAALNRQRRSGRRDLRARNSPGGRSKAALRIARGYADAAKRLRPLAAGDTLRVTSTLAALARDHRALAAASRHRYARAARRAGARIERDERRLAVLLAALTGSRAGS